MSNVKIAAFERINIEYIVNVRPNKSTGLPNGSNANVEPIRRITEYPMCEVLIIHKSESLTMSKLGAVGWIEIAGMGARVGVGRGLRLGMAGIVG
jgi:hypothetical protein